MQALISQKLSGSCELQLGMVLDSLQERCPVKGTIPVASGVLLLEQVGQGALEGRLVASGSWSSREGLSCAGGAGMCARAKQARLRWLCRCFLFFLAEILSGHI